MECKFCQQKEMKKVLDSTYLVYRCPVCGALAIKEHTMQDDEDIEFKWYARL